MIRIMRPMIAKARAYVSADRNPSNVAPPPSPTPSSRAWKTPLPRLLSLILLLCLSVLAREWSAGADQPAIHNTLTTGSQRFLLVSDAASDASRDLAENLRRSLRYAGLAFDEAGLDDLPGLTRERLQDYAALILASESAAGHLYGPDVLGYVSNGGVLLIAIRCWSPDWTPDLGLTSGPGREQPPFTDAAGLSSVGPVFQDIDATYPPQSFNANGYVLQPSADWTIHLRFQRPNLPLLLSRSFGRGSVIFWNGSCLHLKEMRGLFLFSLLRALPVAVMSIFNVVMFEIDDSPPPAFGLASGPVFDHLGLDDYRFYRRVWYPQILGTLQEFAIKPSHYVCITYSGKVNGPFYGRSDRDPFFTEVLNDLKSRGAIIGLHGINHQSLTIGSSPSPPWPDEETMVAALKVARTTFEQWGIVPGIVYVPPNNVLDATGKRALRKGFPDIRGVARVYIGGKYEDVTATGSALTSGDEFGPDPDVPELLNAPRVTSGHFLSQVEEFNLLNGAMAHGVVNHFLHPDDIYDPDRRRPSWEQMLAGFRRLLMTFDRLLPAARKMPVEKFLPHLKRFSEGSLATRQTPEGSLQVSISGLKRPFAYLFSRTGRGRPAIAGGRILRELEPARLFLVEWTNATATVTFP